ncbi:glycosyltransferase [Candidatus Peregrinibacteria bacterium]|nr:glycosyltransferase [Candidatus Peregrinibacteria bacterium]
MRNTISVMLIIYNEEKMIKRCLESLKDCVDEIIIIHDGPCKDESLEIAKKYTDKIIVGSRKGLSDYHYIDAINKCTGDWIFKIDADEYLSEGIRDNLREMVKTEEYDCYSFIWPLWNGKRYLTSKWPIKKALFRKNKISFMEMPHINFVPLGKTKETDYMLGHRPDYNNFSFSTLKSKHKKWVDIHAKLFLKKTDEIRTYNKLPEYKLRWVRLRFKYPITLLLFPIKDILFDIFRFRFLDIGGFLSWHISRTCYYCMLYNKVRKLRKHKQ